MIAYPWPLLVEGTVNLVLVLLDEVGLLRGSCLVAERWLLAYHVKDGHGVLPHQLVHPIVLVTLCPVLLLQDNCVAIAQ